MKTKEEILRVFTSKEAAWYAYREGLQEGFSEALNSLKAQTAIAAMQGYICAPVADAAKPMLSHEEIAKLAVMQANELIKELKKQKDKL